MTPDEEGRALELRRRRQAEEDLAWAEYEAFHAEQIARRDEKAGKWKAPVHNSQDG